MIEQKRKPIGILLTVILIAALLTVCLELGFSYLRPDTPGSIPKHLLHFGIMFALLGSAVLLCLFCSPFKRLWAWIDEHILSQETRPIAIDIIYAVITGLMLLHHFYILLYYPTVPTGATKFAPFWLILAVVTVLLGKSWKEIPFRLAVLFFLFSFERLYLEKLAITGETAVYFFSAIYALFICLNVLSALRPSVRKTFLEGICFLWTSGILILSIIVLYSTWADIRPLNYARYDIRILAGRLFIFAPPNISASQLSCGCIISIIGISVSKHKAAKCLYALACFIIAIANSLTDSRSSFIMLSFLISSIVCFKIWSVCRSQISFHFSNKKAALIFIALLLCFILCLYITIEGQRYLANSFFDIKNRSGILPAAIAEEPVSTVSSSLQSAEFQQRDIWPLDEIELNQTLSGRYEIWGKCIQYINENPLSLVYGLSVDGSITHVIGREDHTHNILLQTLLEGGVPALLLYLSLIFYGTFHAFRLWNHRGIPFWQKILPLPVFSILLWEMAECLTSFSYGHPPMTLLWFFLGATITISKSLGKAPKTADLPAIPAKCAVTETGE